MTNGDDDDNDSFCHVCLKETKEILEYNTLQVCSKCLSNIKRLESEKGQSRLSKEQIAGGLKDEL